jgi:sensor c-di-GMP phosphodiesterase-like protein
VIAEGIETCEQENFLRKHECDVGQGYYFAKPMDGEAFITFVQEQNKNEE